MVSLTSLLVLTGLFAQTASSIPKTSYLKLIDWWYLALITFDFTVIMILVVVEVLLKYTPTQASKGCVVPFRQKLFYPYTNWALMINKVAIAVFIIVLVMIVAAFAAVAKLT